MRRQLAALRKVYDKLRHRVQKARTCLAPKPRAWDRGVVARVRTWPLTAITAVSVISLTMIASAAEVRLDELNLGFVKQGWGLAHANESAVGKPLQLGGRIFAHGVGTHAPSLAIISLGKQGERFRAVVGVNDTGRLERGSVEFLVYPDDRLVFKSGILRGGDRPQVVDVPLGGVNVLKLEVTTGGDNNFADHADWADAGRSCSTPRK